ncbi:MAG TPA: arsenite methyltransferase [Thermodesulfobacteriota bacterium]|nr:arsenite methyltransferase [Thermodesulfobacteriota bacterium]
MKRKATRKKEIKQVVKEKYSKLAKVNKSCCCPSDEAANRAYVDALYRKEEIEGLSKDVTDMSMGCGNPTAIANLNPGEVVLDLGSGGGIDAFLAAKKVGPQGKVIGLDMTEEMIHRAQENARNMGFTNVEFKMGEMESIPLPENSVDVVISNCVINLSPDKDSVFREIFRVLKPKGRIAVSDIVTDGKLPKFIKQDVEAWTSCIGGALKEQDYLSKIRASGFTNVAIESKHIYSHEEISMFKETNSSLFENPLGQKEIKAVEGKIASIRVTAQKPEVDEKNTCCCCS